MKQFCMMLVKYHHERVDGKGYPEGLAGEEIPVDNAMNDSFSTATFRLLSFNMVFHLESLMCQEHI